jgi:iron complex outermembrane receptor protein
MQPLYRRMSSPECLASITSGFGRSLGVLLMRLMIVAAVCTLMASLALADPAQAAIKMPTDIPAQGLGPALKTLAKVRGFQVVFRTEVVGSVRTHGASGDLTTSEALTKLLEGTNLAYTYLDENTVTILPRTEVESGSAADPQGAPAHSGGTAGDAKQQEGTKRNSFRLAQSNQGVAQNSSTVASDAQSSAANSENSPRLEEVIVTAQKREERLQDVPVPVTVLSAQALSDNGLVLLRDYYTSVPGLSVSPNIENTQMLSIRGVTTGGFTTSTVGVAVDDVPFGSPVKLGQVPDFDPGDLARVEVLRGPQGTLYGANSMGGLIKYVTVDPSTEGYSGRVEAGTSDVYHGAESGFNLRASANIPVSDTLAFRVSGFQRQDPGYVDSEVLNIRGINEAQAYGGRIAALWQPFGTFSLKVSALYQRVKGYTSEVDNSLGQLQQNYVAGGGRYDESVEAYSAILKADLGGVDLTSVTGYNKTRNLAAFDYTPFFGSLTKNGIPGSGFNGFGVTGTLLNVYNTTPTFTQELRFSGSVWNSLDWLVGGFYEHAPSPGSENYDTVTGSDPISGRVVGQEWYYVADGLYQEYAGFANLTYHFSDRFDVQVGGRESHTENGTSVVATGPLDYTFYGTAPPMIIPRAGSSANTFTYLVTPRLKLADDLMLYIRLASGYRPGGPNTGAPGAPAEYAPDKTKNYELGFKGDFFGRTLSVDASLFYIDWKDLQLQLFTPNGYSYTANGSAAKSEGVELSATLRPLEGLTIAAWVAYDDAALTEAFPASSTAYGVPGDRLPNTPRFSGNLSLHEEFPLSSSVTGFVGSTVSYVGDRVSVFQGTSMGLPLPRQNFPSYTKTDLRAGIKYDSWTVNAYVNNVANIRGLINGGAGYIEPSAYVYITPRTAGLDVVKSF